MDAPRVLVSEEELDVSTLPNRHLSRLACQVAIPETGGKGPELACAGPPGTPVRHRRREVVRRLRADDRTWRCHLIASVLDPQDLVELATGEPPAKPFWRSAVTRFPDSYRRAAPSGGVMAFVLRTDDDTDIRDMVALQLVLLPIRMPRMSGLDVCRQLRALPETATRCVVLLTARSQEGDDQSGFAAGADGYRIKPFSPRELNSRVQAALTGVAR